MMSQIDRVFHNHEKWEDYKSGMFNPKKINNGIDLISLAKALLSNPKNLLEGMTAVCFNWKISCEANLTNSGCNRQAWLGQATCFYKHKVPEELTKIAWNELTEKQQKEANGIADKVILEWEKNYLKGRTKNAKKNFKVKCLRS